MSDQFEGPMVVTPDGSGYFSVTGWPGEDTRDGYRMEPMEVVPAWMLRQLEATVAGLVERLEGKSAPTE